MLVKRYIDESGSDQARSLLKKYRVISSRVALIEAASTFRRRRDSGDLHVRHFSAILKRFDADRAFFELIEPTREVLDRAGKLARESKVRSLDAIHISSILCFNDSLDNRAPFITADNDQRRAALKSALDIIFIG